jgi:hypothetical protein
MRPNELEAKVLGLAERVEARHPIEDSLVELKAEWIEPAKAARRLAGHCNASRSAPVLWVVGLDEKRGAVGTPESEFADWWAQVKSQFDGISPELALHLTVRHRDKTLVAMYYETDRAPFVVDLTDDGQSYKYEYDAFLRLRKVKNQSNALVAEYRYNGLGHRIAVHEDTDSDLDVDSNDKWYYDAFDERWT